MKKQAPIITIDGPSGSGKTAVGPELARRFNLPFLSIGTLFRAAAWSVHKNMTLAEFFRKLEIGQRGSILLPSIGGQILGEELYQNPQLEALTPILAADPTLRAFLHDKVRALSASSGLIAEGRTAGKVFENAGCKVYLTADKEERLKRNLQESRRLGVQTDEKELASIRKARDEKDASRKTDPLRISSDMLVWDSTYSTFEQTCSRLERHLKHHLSNEKLRISLIIPVRNRQEHLTLCLAALAKQTLPKDQYEIIVIDDGSSDASAEIARQSGAKVIRSSHKGPSAARNLGIEQASGEIILFLDADILVEPDFLAKLQERHARTNDLLLLGARRHLPEGATTYENQPVRLDSREKLLKGYSYCLSHLNHPWSLAYTCVFSVSKSLLEQERFDESFTGWGLEDIEFAFRLCQRGARAAFSPCIPGYHLYHDRTFDAKRYESWLANLARFTAKHSHPGVQSFNLFKPVFNPAVLANFFDVFAAFEGRKPDPSSPVLDLSLSSQDPLSQIQDWIAENPGKHVVLTDDPGRILYEIYLPFIGKGAVQAFLPKGGP